MGRIPESFINELIDRCDIVELIGSRVPLKRAGREYSACCPFHDEKTPSFTVSPQKQFYHCFGCGEHGTAIGFVMNYDRLEFVDAVEMLAAELGLEVPREAGSGPRHDYSDLYAILASAEAYYRGQLRRSDAAITYLKDRGISGDIAASFGIGFAPDRWDGLLGELGKSASAIKLLEQSGMLSQRDGGGHYDKFRGRVMFPIHDQRGRAIAFGGRVFLHDSGPKYLNSPETRLFHKGRQLYGLFEAKQANKKLERLIVVEGYMDVVALAQFGLTESVATLGTATTADHAETLFRAAPDVVFCFDGDRAGRQAAVRAMENVIPRLRDGRQARFLFLPDGEDPDSMVRAEGAEAFRQRLSSAQPLSEFFFEHHANKVDMNSLDGRAKLIEISRPELNRLPDSAFRDMMFEELGRRAKTSVVKSTPKAGSSAPPRPAEAGRPSLVREAIAVLVAQPSVAEATQLPLLENVALRGIELLRELIAFVQASPGATSASLIQHWQDRPEQRHLVKLLQTFPLETEHDLSAQFDDVTTRLHQMGVTQRRAELIAKQSAEGLSDAEKEELRRLLADRNQPRPTDPGPDPG